MEMGAGRALSRRKRIGRWLGHSVGLRHFVEARIMKKRTLKTIALVALAGTLFQFGGCVGQVLKSFITSLPATLLTEFVTDNNGIFDLFADS
jgi:hypothetical protein